MKHLLLASLSILALSLCVPAAIAQNQNTPPCSQPEAKQFDFWVGTWHLTWEGGTGTNRIEKKLGQCVIQENFHGDMGKGQFFDGMSVSSYNARTKKWEQTWVDSSGGFLTFEGGMVGPNMVLNQTTPSPDGKSRRMIFKNIKPGSLDWDWQASEDGENWTSVWAIHYAKR